MKFSHTQNKKGFTLIETLIAILIFSFSVVALITITSTGSADGNYVKEKQTAYLLSQEGVELVRYMRDTIMRNGGLWSGAGGFIDTMSTCIITDLVNPEPGCNFDTKAFAEEGASQVTLNSCAIATDCQFYYDPATGFYSTSPLLVNTGVATDFIRRIRIYPLPSSINEARIISSVVFEYGGRTFEVKLEEVINGWVIPVTQ